MKVKTSVTLSEELLSEIDQHVQNRGRRSALIEQAVRFYLARIRHDRQAHRDLEILNASAEQLNREAEDVLGYQT